MSLPTDEGLGRVVRLVALLNLTYFGVEFTVAIAIGSVSLFADSIDFLEDASINLLIAFALSWTAKRRAMVGMILAGILLVPGIATLWTAWVRFNTAVPPEPFALSLTGAGALAVNLTCAFLLARYRRHSGSLTRAAFLSARNDALANVGIVAAGVVTALTASVWPDLIVGIAIAVMNADAARDVWKAARKEGAALEEEEGEPSSSPRRHDDVDLDRRHDHALEPLDHRRAGLLGLAELGDGILDQSGPSSGAVAAMDGRLSAIANGPESSGRRSRQPSSFRRKSR